MAPDNSYEAVRKQRLEENKKRFEDLGILSIKKTLAHLSNSPNKSKAHILKPKGTKNEEPFEPRRSTRARNSVTSYVDDLDIGLPSMRKRSGSKSSWDSYIARPAEECIMASYEDRVRTLKVAEEFQSNLQSGKPSFVKSMVRSHVYSCFWLGLPTQFCNDHLPKEELDMILVDETGAEYDAKYLGKRTGLSGGWRGFALDHKLDDGDALVFELEEADRFKIYTFRLSSCCDRSQDVNAMHSDETTDAAKKSKKRNSQSRDAAKKSKKRNSESRDAAKKSKKDDSRSNQTRKTKKAKAEQKDESLNDEETRQDEAAENGSIDEEAKPIKNDGAVSVYADVKKWEPTADNKVVVRNRKKAAPKLFRKKA